MLDWHKAVADMCGSVAEVHIVSVGGECKELLLVADSDTHDSVSVTCVNDTERFSFTHTDFTMGQIAQMIGYTTSSRFAELFKKSTGILPIEYRKIAKRTD